MSENSAEEQTPVETSPASDIREGTVFSFPGDEASIRVDDVFVQLGQGLGALVRGRWVHNGNPFSHRFLDLDTDQVVIRS